MNYKTVRTIAFTKDKIIKNGRILEIGRGRKYNDISYDQKRIHKKFPELIIIKKNNFFSGLF